MRALFIALVFCVACGSSTQVVRQTHARTHLDVPSMQIAGNDSQECQIRSVYFESDSAELNQDARMQLGMAAGCLRAGRAHLIQITGSADERGTEEYNLALGERRAQAVLGYLARLGVNQNTMRYSSVGEEFAQGRNAEGWARDRHVETIAFVAPVLASASVREELGSLLSSPRTQAF